jgi:hypothetical protein
VASNRGIEAASIGLHLVQVAQPEDLDGRGLGHWRGLIMTAEGKFSALTKRPLLTYLSGANGSLLAPIGAGRAEDRDKWPMRR